MKRLKSYGDDLDSVGEKGVIKDWGRRDLQDSERSSSHQHQHHQHHHHRRRFYSKSESLRKGLSCSSSSYDRDEERESSRSLRKRFDHDSDGFDRRKNFDRYNRDSVSSSPRNSSYNVERIHRSDSFSGFRREFPKGLRSDRERPRRDESVSSSWRRFSSTKDGDDEDSSRGNRAAASDQDRVSQRSPQGLRDVEDRVNRRSPRESRDIIEERVSRRSPLGSGDTVKSPQFSKDSSCEQSKSMEVLKKSDEVQKESGVSSEMEEGELEPEPHDNPESEPAPKPETSLGANSDSQKDVESDHVEFVGELDKEAATLSSGVKLEVNGGKVTATMEEVKQIIKLPDCLDDSIDGPEGAASKTTVVNESGKNEVSLKENREVLSSTDEKVCPSDDVQGIGELNGGNLLVSGDGDGEKEDKSTSIEVKGDVVNVNVDASSITEKTEEKRRTNGSLDFSMDKPIEDSKNKGKSFAVLPPIEANLLENCKWMETGSTNIRDDVMEGPRGRGFELFFSPVVKRVEKMSSSCSSKHKDVNLKLEPLELSLGLPNVSLPLVSREPDPAPNSYSLARSVPSLPHTLHSNSDAFTASVSFSGSQTFIHNPSCSLTQNSHDNYEKSVGSRPIFQGIDQVSHGAYPGQSSNELKNKESPLYHQMLSSGNGSLYASQVSQGLLNSQSLDGQHFLKAPQMSTGSPVSLNRQTSVSRQLSGVFLRQHDEVRSPSQSNGSSETRSECSIEKKRLLKGKSGSSLFRSNSQREIEQTVTGGTIFLEGFISAVVSEPIQPMSSRLHEMTEQSVACLKEIAYDIITKEHKHAQLLAYQKNLQDRSDISFETLSKSHRVQLEILVAFKTGLSDFIRQAINVPSSNLIEIFLNRRCRNVACQSLLPVDECDCKVCTNKVGFCSACMCLVCSKFDMASNTCSWVGCDVCLHWCHTNCGIKKSYIRNGRSATEEAHAMTEMQFHCVACNHPSEMFGFVREVFRTCAKDWKAETLSRELGYVMRIFSASNDTRGKQLNVSAGQMMTRLKDKTCLPEVYNHIMEFLNGSHSNFGNNTTFSAKAPILENSKTNSMVLPSSQETMLLASVSAEKTSRFENVGTSQQILDWNQIGVSSGNPELQMSIERKPFVDELESILRVKQAEAKMFQARSDDARREADGLKRIAIAKNAKIEEEYLSRLNRLNLVEAEERRRQKLEELQAVERAYREYLNMKMRMDGEIKDLLLRMEATRRNLNA